MTLISIVMKPIGLLLSTVLGTAGFLVTYVSAWLKFFFNPFKVACYCDACWNSSALRVGVKTLLNAILSQFFRL